MLNHRLNHLACINGANFNIPVIAAKHSEYLICKSLAHGLHIPEVELDHAKLVQVL
jgi:hypothetical protein